MKTPHKHAELIKKWADDTSLIFQSRINESGTWADTKPDWSINVEYRIKPEVIRYRVALLNFGNRTFSVSSDEIAKETENHRYFSKWLTDWIEVEV